MSGDKDSDEQVQPESGEMPEPDASVSAAADLADQPSPAPVQKKAASGRWPALLALLLSLLALGLSAWLLLEHQTDAPESALVAMLEQRTEGLERQTRSLESTVEEQGNSLEALNERLQVLAREELNELPGQIVALNERVSAQATQSADQQTDLEALKEELALVRGELREAVEQLSDRDQLERRAERDLQRQMAMTEAAALLRLGQDRLALAADLPGAVAAFRRAEARLAGVDDPRLDRVRRALAEELEALESARPPDLARALARLDRLARDSADWPLQLPGMAPADDEEPAEGWRARIGQTMSGLVRVQQRDAVGRTEAQFAAAREQVQLRLVAAQLALGRRDAAVWAVHLQAAVGLIDDWFDASADVVETARQEIETLIELDLSPDEPALGRALDLLMTRLSES